MGDKENQRALAERFKAEYASESNARDAKEKARDEFLLALCDRYCNDDKEPELKSKAQALKIEAVK